jgi:hypothetical protein
MKNLAVKHCRGGILAVGGCLLLSTLGASAVPITGEIHFGGQFTPIDSGSSASSLGSATGIKFVNPSLVLAASGDFASYVTPWISQATFVPEFQFNPLSPSPVAPLWSAGGFSFTMNAVQITLQTSDQLTLLGTGYLSGNGYDMTYGSWNFTGQGSGLFTFSADNVASRSTNVPDGGNTVVLLGLGLLSLVAVASKRVALATT